MKPSRRAPSPLASGLRPLEGALWIVFLLVTAVMAVVWAGDIGGHQIERAIPNAGLQATLERLLLFADLAWFTLAAVSLHQSLAEAEGLAVARHWALISFGGAALMAILSAAGFLSPGLRTVYGGALGMKIGPVPIGVLLLWYVVVLGARETVLRIAPKASQIWLAIGAGVLVGLTGLNLENTAARFRGYWFWVVKDPPLPGLPPVFQPPAGEYLAWFIFGAGILFFLREQRIAANPGKRSWKPAIIFALLNVVFLLANCGRAMRG